MENKYHETADGVIIEVPYCKQIVRVTIDKDDLALASSINGRWICIQLQQKYKYFVCNRDKSISLHKLIAGVKEDERVYLKDKNHTNLRKSNLLVNTYDVDEAFRELRRHSYQNMSSEGKERFLNGMKNNRYSKEWSDQLSTAKKGRKNPKTVLNPALAKTIRHQYFLENKTQQELAETHLVARTTIADVVNYRTWNEIGENPHKDYRKFKESDVEKIELDLRSTPVQEYEFTIKDIWHDEFLLHAISNATEEYIFCQKIGEIKLYVEVRNHKKEFIHSFELVFPDFLTPQHIHNYVISQRKPVRYMNRHGVHNYVKVLSTFLFGDSVQENEAFPLQG